MYNDDYTRDKDQT